MDGRKNSKIWGDIRGARDEGDTFTEMFKRFFLIQSPKASNQQWSMYSQGRNQMFSQGCARHDLYFSSLPLSISPFSSLLSTCFSFPISVPFLPPFFFYLPSFNHSLPFALYPSPFFLLAFLLHVCTFLSVSLSHTFSFSFPCSSLLSPLFSSFPFPFFSSSLSSFPFFSPFLSLSPFLFFPPFPSPFPFSHFPSFLLSPFLPKFFPNFPRVGDSPNSPTL